MTKSFYLIFGAVTFTAGFALATGVDQNPVQAVYAVMLMGVSCVSFRRADAMEKQESEQEGAKSASINNAKEWEEAA